ncbi:MULTISPECIES: TetR/AcrR family transcriptional regulator [unclassified Crossiella]|uniref:TetR/AcrR family transcriptional regulator n=1 Tax=Crossiella sp. CA-258035 TaxID=2981138 RepID=UPI0024BD3CA1|nr:TetR/AcrR family transcriptional regulator [Crossiella sp. CA-258035]WHT19142.1 TetR/AcrR family transcriptional regulator [Crossiella sp. CA-258035]
MPRPPAPLLSVDRIRTAALEIIDQHGLEALTMRRLAHHIGVQAASLYNHVRTKEQLLHDVANELATEVDTSAFGRCDWREALTIYLRSYRSVLARHPNIVPLLSAGPGRRESGLKLADAVHGGLVSAGWPPKYATMIGAATKYLVFGAAMGSFSQGFDDDEQLYAERYPNLAQAHLLRGRAEIDTEAFELALRVMLDGLTNLWESLEHPDGQQRDQPAGDHGDRD